MKKITVKRLAFDAIFAAITAVLYCYVKFKLPIFPSFLDVNISMIAVIIAAFMLGPWDAGVLVIIRFLMKILLVGTSTQYVGELADILIGIVPAIGAGVIYNYTKWNHKTLFAFIFAVASWVLMGIISNIFINIPFYSSFYFKQNYYTDGVPNALVGMCGSAFELITFGLVKADTVTSSNFMVYYIFFAVIPFNLMLSLGVTLITALVHQRLKVLYDMIPNNFKKAEQKEEIVDNTEDDSKEELSVE